MTGLVCYLSSHIHMGTGLVYNFVAVLHLKAV